MHYFHSWSGGKDSTAAIILDHIHGLPPSRIVFCEIMYDLKRGISGELPEHIDFVKNIAIPKFKEWGFAVDVVRAETDYMDNFYHVITKSRNGNNGKMRGFPLSGRCTISRDCKIKPIHDYYKKAGLKPEEITQYVGIAIDEPERLERIRGTNKVSVLELFGYTEQMALELCQEYGLLSPSYQFATRGGVLVLPEPENGRTGTPEREPTGPVGRTFAPGHRSGPRDYRLQVRRNLRPGRPSSGPVDQKQGFGRMSVEPVRPTITEERSVNALKWSITTQERNALVETHLGCIWWTINKNRRLIVAAGLDDDDVFQQLAVRMIRAVENYDPDKGKDLEQHIFAQLQYEVLNCKDAAKVYGIKGAPYGARDLTVSLEAMVEGGCQFAGGGGLNA